MGLWAVHWMATSSGSSWAGIFKQAGIILHASVHGPLHCYALPPHASISAVAMVLTHTPTFLTKGYSIQCNSDIMTAILLSTTLTIPDEFMTWNGHSQEYIVNCHNTSLVHYYYLLDYYDLIKMVPRPNRSKPATLSGMLRQKFAAATALPTDRYWLSALPL